jgi:trimeric autotransporter adhesin
MKKLIQTLSIIVGVGASLGSMAQNVTTPSGSPLIIGNNGVRLANIAASTATASNPGSGVLSVAANGDLIYVPGGSSQWTTSGMNLNYAPAGNVGVGVVAPAYKLDVNGDINIPTGSALRVNGGVMLRNFGTDNLAIGLSAGNGTGSQNTFIGRSAGQLATGGNNNVAIGFAAGYNNSGDDNTMIGYGTGGTGNGNTVIGYFAGSSNTGNGNVFVGNASGGAVNTGNNNTFIGPSAGNGNTNGQLNFMGGYGAGQGNKGGTRNTFVGTNAGATTNPAGNSDFNTAIGFDARIATGVMFSTAIGVDAVANVSDAIVLGRTTANVNVGIGTSSPAAALHILRGSVGGGTSGLRIGGLAGLGAGKALSVDANGDVVLVTNAARLADTEIKDLIKENIKEISFSDANWKMINNNVVNTNVGGVVIGNEITATPAGYKMFVSDGILTERVTVAVKNSDEWADYVFKPSYQLKPLTEVESFIKANKHLPGIPSAQEMVQKGNDLHQTDVKLLQKVEELTLYMIEMEKRLAKTEAENAKLKKALKTRK